MNNLIKVFIVFVFLNSVIFINSSIINALSASNTHVQSAINSSASGDIIMIPKGTVTWTGTVIVPSNKKIVLCGAGVNDTIISSNLSTEVLELNTSGSRVTQICFKLMNDDGVGIHVSGLNWRIDHCKFDFVGASDYTIEGVYAYGNTANHPIGVIDHNVFNNIRVYVMGHQSTLAHERWAEPLGLGTNNAVFIEDNVITRTYKDLTAVDSGYGGRYVFRYNTVNNAQIMAHSVQSNDRASRSWEVYNNTINQYGLNLFAPFFMRGGTGVIFNNTLIGNWSHPYIVVDNYRTFQYFEPGGLADGDSLWDGNEDATGYPARDQIGRSTDEHLWTTSDPYPKQALEPMYQWNNKINGSNMIVYVHNGCDNHIKVNRDYYNANKSGYTPYQYPHPLVKEDDKMPSHLRIK